ncbi:MAG: hypothetical protein O7F09_07080 [Chloroflexi bacterium]|nr:hypothetical protein [Chloroflexota bacterium]
MGQHPPAVALLGEGITGVLGPVSGSSDQAIYLNLHRITGFAILALLPWKSRVVLRALRRRRRMVKVCGRAETVEIGPLEVRSDASGRVGWAENITPLRRSSS